MLLGPGDAQSEVGALPASRCCVLAFMAGGMASLRQRSKPVPWLSRLEVKEVQEDQLEIQSLRKWRQNSNLHV